MNTLDSLREFCSFALPSILRLLNTSQYCFPVHVDLDNVALLEPLTLSILLWKFSSIIAIVAHRIARVTGFLFIFLLGVVKYADHNVSVLSLSDPYFKFATALLVDRVVENILCPTIVGVDRFYLSSLDFEAVAERLLQIMKTLCCPYWFQQYLQKWR